MQFIQLLKDANFLIFIFSDNQVCIPEIINQLIYKIISNQSAQKVNRAEKGQAQGLAWSFSNKQTLKPELYPFKFAKLQPNEVRVKIHYFGVGPKDLEVVKSSKFDVFVPGQQVVGVVEEVGQNVGVRKVGDIVGVGLIKGNCKNCSDFGGFATHMQVASDWVFPLPNNIPLEQAAPLFSAGIIAFNIISSEYQRLKYNFKRKLRVAIVGLGAVGHMILKFANQFNYDISVFSHSAKKQEVLKSNGLKYDNFFIENEENFKKNELKFDLVIVSGEIQKEYIQSTVNLARRTGKVVLVNSFSGYINIVGALLVVDQKEITGVRTGNKDNFYKMLELVGKVTSNQNKSLLPICEQFSFDQFETVLEKVKQNSVLFKAVVKVQENIVSKFNNGEF